MSVAGFEMMHVSRHLATSLDRMTILRARQVWKRARKPRSRETLDRLTPEEAANVAIVVKVLCVRLGTTTNVAKAMQTNPKPIQRAVSGKSQPSAGMAIKVAKLAGVPVDDVLSGAFPVAGSCPMCGRGAESN